MSFAQPLALLVLLALPVSAALVAWAAKRRARALRSIAEPHLLDSLVADAGGAGRALRLGLWALALACLALALARPQWGVREAEVRQEGIQVVVALDVSASMLARDVRPDRLTRAKLEVIDLMDRLDGDEVALVLFSGAAFVQLPLTSDYLTARRFLDAAGTWSISTPGTVVGRAIRTATGAFDHGREGSKAIVLMTDGEDSEPDTVAAAREAADSGVTIFAVGFGSPQGEPVPELDPAGNVSGYKTDASGNRVLSRLDEQTLRDVADAAGGAYLQPAGAAAALAGEIDGLEAARLEGRVHSQPIERFQIFLGAAVAALVLAELIPESMPGGALRRRLGL